VTRERPSNPSDDHPQALQVQVLQLRPPCPVPGAAGPPRRDAPGALGAAAPSRGARILRPHAAREDIGEVAVEAFEVVCDKSWYH
jgi:hypothetical protein